MIRVHDAKQCLIDDGGRKQGEKKIVEHNSEFEITTNLRVGSGCWTFKFLVDGHISEIQQYFNILILSM